MIWFLVGIGAGLAVALIGFVLMAVVDGRRLRRLAEMEEIEGADEVPAERRMAPEGPLADVPPDVAPVQRRRPAIAELRNAASADGVVDEMMSNLAAEIARMQSSDSATLTIELPASTVPMQGVVEPAVQASMPEAPLTPMRAAMAEALARPAEPVRKAPPIVPKPVVKPAIKPVQRPVAKPEPLPPQAIVEATPEPVEPVAVEPAPPPKPKIPPLPRVAPARKFAPALPQRKPN
jgi:hypothetical protein